MCPSPYEKENQNAKWSPLATNKPIRTLIINMQPVQRWENGARLASHYWSVSLNWLIMIKGDSVAEWFRALVLYFVVIRRFRV